MPARKELTAYARFANAVPWRLAHRENFAAKAPGLVNGGSAPPTLSAHTREPLAFRPDCADTWDNLHITWQLGNLDRWPEMLTFTMHNFT
jgi:hypothetical protein